VGEKTERERKSSVLEVPVEDAMAVKVVNGIENRVDDDDNIVLGRLSLCEDAVEQLPAGSKFKGERQTMLGWSRPVRRSISVQTLASFPFTFFFLMTLRTT